MRQTYYIYEDGISRQKFYAQPDDDNDGDETPESSDVGTGWDDTYGEDTSSGDNDTEDE